MTDPHGWNSDMTDAPPGVKVLVCRASDWERTLRLAKLDGSPLLLPPAFLPADRWREIEGPAKGDRRKNDG